MEPFGQTMVEDHDDAAAERRQRAIDKGDLKPAIAEAIRLKGEAERAHEDAVYALQDMAADLLTGRATEADVEEAEAALDRAARDVRRWSAALSTLEDRAGIIRDGQGAILSR